MSNHYLIYQLTMKPVRDSCRSNDYGKEGDFKRATKLAPMHKSGKERRAYYAELDDDEFRETWNSEVRRESVLDYYDDES